MQTNSTTPIRIREKLGNSGQLVIRSEYHIRFSRTLTTHFVSSSLSILPSSVLFVYLRPLVFEMKYHPYHQNFSFSSTRLAPLGFDLGTSRARAPPTNCGSTGSFGTSAYYTSTTRIVPGLQRRSTRRPLSFPLLFRYAPTLQLSAVLKYSIRRLFYVSDEDCTLYYATHPDKLPLSSLSAQPLDIYIPFYFHLITFQRLQK